MIDVRLTATNPEDSTLVPVPCNVRGELLTVAPVIEVIPNDLEIQGDLTVTGLINGSTGVGEPGPPGPEGPEGPAGSIDLPPDPYEGALLGWEDGQLAWVGGTVPLPEGIYGPLIYQDGTIIVPQLLDLVNGQQIYMSDNAGNRAYYTTQTSSITNVLADAISLEGTTSDNWSGVPKPVYYGSISNVFNQTGSSQNTQSGWWGAYKTGNTSQEKKLILKYTLRTPYTGGRKIEIYSKGSSNERYGQIVSDGFAQSTRANTWLELPSPFTYFGMEIWVNGDDPTTSIGLGGIRFADTGEPITDPANAGLSGNFTLTFEDSTDLQYFDVGQELQGGAATILSIDESTSQIVVNGGTWSAGDQGITGGLISGDGSVSTSIGNSIVLRSDNEEWVNDFYVTAPAQRIAARKAIKNARNQAKK